jgi:hypothetical protein
MKSILTLLALSFVLSLKIVAQNDSSNLTITYMSSAPIFNDGPAEQFLPVR